MFTPKEEEQLQSAWMTLARTIGIPMHDGAGRRAVATVLGHLLTARRHGASVELTLDIQDGRLAEFTSRDRRDGKLIGRTLFHADGRITEV